MVIAVNRPGSRGGMTSHFAKGEPDRDDKAPALELDAMPRPGGDDLPVVCFPKWLERLRDFHRLTPGDAVIRALDGEAPGVVDAVQEMNRARFVVNNRERIVNGLLVLATFLLLGIAFN